MRKLILVSVALALVLAVVPAMAGDQSTSGKKFTTFQALGKMPAPKSMTDDQLASVEGKSYYYFDYQSNYASVYQFNAGFYGNQYNDAYVDQVNFGGGSQSNSAFVSQGNFK